MPPRRLRTLALAAALALPLAGALGCPGESGPRVPAAEFLVAAGDSTFWVTSDGGRVRVRGAPLQLARVDGRFVELYVVDDDRSYFDAVLVGQRVYRRDLITNDSVLVFRDTVVAGLAERYAELHPEERPLGPDDDAAERPATIASVELELLPVYGPHLSYEYHADLDADFAEEVHETRRGVLDLRSGAASTLAALFGDTAAVRLAAAGRAQFEVLLDSVLAARRDEATRAAEAIGDFDFDATSFSLLDSARAPQVLFVVPGRGEAGGGLVLPVTPIAAPALPWWTAIADRLPLNEGDTTLASACPPGDREACRPPALRWPRDEYEVVARFDGAVQRVVLAIRDTLDAEWSAARLPAPVAQIYWLDRPAIDSSTRRALEAAFDEAALYSEDVRSVSRPGRARRSRRGTASAASASIRIPVVPQRTRATS
jgi:hypothetical protein